MVPDDRLERLERRLHDLEELVLDLRAGLDALRAAPPAPHPSSDTTTAERMLAASPPRETPLSSPRVGPLAARPAAVAPSHMPPRQPQMSSGFTRTASGSTTAAGSGSTRTFSAEEWIGQRGLLAAGVFLLILAAAYFLKLAFDRGWISPAMRCMGGALVGMGIGVVGWRAYQRGFRTYGAALMGCGAGIAYLAVWAAVRLYTLLPTALGLGILAALSLAVFAIAALVNVEALAAAAVLGAFLAPVMVGRGGNPNALLIYAFFLALGLGAVARKRWRLTTFLVALSFFALGFLTTGTGRPDAFNLFMYCVLGASGGMYVGLRERWGETRFLSFWAGWTLLWSAGDIAGHLVAAGGVILAGPIWWHAWHEASVLPDHNLGSSGVLGPAESLYFYVTPLWLAWALGQWAPAWSSGHAWALTFIVALPYLAVGYLRRRVPFAIVGTSGLAVAVLQLWSGPPAVWALLALALLWAGLDHALDRTDGRWYGLAAVAVALIHLFDDLMTRGAAGPAFLDRWAVTLWLAIATLSLLAAGLWRQTPEDRVEPPRKTYWQQTAIDARALRHAMPALVWTTAGALLFWGVTQELARFFAHSGMAADTASLAGGLSVSAWWAVFAAALVVLGFRLRDKRVRVAGLLGSALAAGKVLLVDLSQLDALYRVASVFILGLISLGVAYLYHRHARSLEPPPGGTVVS